MASVITTVAEASGPSRPSSWALAGFFRHILHVVAAERGRPAVDIESEELRRSRSSAPTCPRCRGRLLGWWARPAGLGSASGGAAPLRERFGSTRRSGARFGRQTAAMGRAG